MKVSTDMKMAAVMLRRHLDRIDAIAIPDVMEVITKCDEFLSSPNRAVVFSEEQKERITHAVLDQILKEHGC
jgi:hypothetical protein